MNNLNKKQIKAIALLVLNAQQKDNSQENCPTPLTIANYCADRLSKSARKQFRADIIKCPESYGLWMDMENYSMIWNKKSNTAKSNVQLLYDRLMGSWQYTFSVVTTVCIVLFSMILMMRESINIELGNSYEMAFLYPSTTFDFSVQRNLKSFNFIIDEDKKSFQSGVKNSIQYIQKKSYHDEYQCVKLLAHCQSKADFYHYIGAWSLLTKMSCLENDVTLYQQQKILLKRWYDNKASIIINNNDSGLNSRLTVLYSHIISGKQRAVCVLNDELLRFAML